MLKKAVLAGFRVRNDDDDDDELSETLRGNKRPIGSTEVHERSRRQSGLNTREFGTCTSQTESKMHLKECGAKKA